MTYKPLDKIYKPIVLLKILMQKENQENMLIHTTLLKLLLVIVIHTTELSIFLPCNRYFISETDSN